MKSRAYARFPTRCLVYFAGEDLEGAGQLVEISLAGCVVESDVPVTTGMFLQLEVNLAGHEPPLVIALAPVRWANGQRFGVEFIGIDTDPQDRVRRFVRTLASIRAQPTRSPRAKRAQRK